MKLHEDKRLFSQAIRFTSDQLHIPAVYVEKDYWVTFALFTLYNHEIGESVIFKGGTALSKCYKIIERFSEDIDLVVLRKDKDSNNQLSNRIKKVGDVVSEFLPEVYIEGLTHKRGMNRKTAHAYIKRFQGDYGQVRNDIVLEATWLGYFEPYTRKNICSFVGKMMIDNNQKEMAEKYNLLPFEVLVLEPTRTICEKIMSLVRFSYGEEPLEDLKKKIRHAYDLHQLLLKEEFKNFLISIKFEEMLLKVANDDVESYKTKNKWLENHPTKALIFDNLEEIWEDLRKVYENEFNDLVYGKLPDHKEILKTLQFIKERLGGIKWTITVPSKKDEK